MTGGSVKQLTTISLLLVVLCGGLVARADSSSETGPPARRLRAAGSEEVLWLVSAEWNEEQVEFSRRFLYFEAGADRIQASGTVSHAQQIGAIATAGSTLHVFFQDGSHLRFSKSRQWRGHPLPGPRLPLALAGETLPGGSRVWAVVSAETAAWIEDQWRDRQARQVDDGDQAEPFQPADRSSVSPRLSATDASRTHHIVAYDGLVWQPGILMPDEYRPADSVWLAVSGGRFHLLWDDQDKPDQLCYAVYAKNRWTMGPAIETPGPVDAATVSIANKQLVFAALIKQPDLAMVRCVQWSRAVAAPPDEPWDQADPLLDEDGSELVLARGSAVGLFSDRLALLRFGETAPELGLWSAGRGGQAERGFEPFPPAGQEGSAARRSLRDLMATLMIAAVLVLLLWKRQEAMSMPLELPAHLQVAGPGRRATAFLMDAAPAALLVLWIWYEPITSFYEQVKAAGQAGEPMPVPPVTIFWAVFWFRVVYVTYAACFELATASTPGKRLMGCHVLSEDLTPANPLQIGIRNVSRMVELEPFLKIWPFLLIVFFTRNRQRLGDLLARTITVEQQVDVLADEQSGDESGPPGK